MCRICHVQLLLVDRTFSYFKLLLDSLIRFSTFSWDNPSMLTPFTEIITSPMTNLKSELREDTMVSSRRDMLSVHMWWELHLSVFHCRVKVCVRRMWVVHLRSAQRSQLRWPPSPCTHRCTSPLQSWFSAAPRTSAKQEAIFHKTSLRAWHGCADNYSNMSFECYKNGIWLTWISKPNSSLSCFSKTIVILCKKKKKKRKIHK